MKALPVWTIKGMAKAWRMKPAAIRALIARGRIPAASKLGRDWVVPAGTLRPIDLRYAKPQVD